MVVYGSPLRRSEGQDGAPSHHSARAAEWGPEGSTTVHFHRSGGTRSGSERIRTAVNRPAPMSRRRSDSSTVHSSRRRVSDLLAGVRLHSSGLKRNRDRRRRTAPNAPHRAQETPYRLTRIRLRLSMRPSDPASRASSIFYTSHSRGRVGKVSWPPRSVRRVPGRTR